MTQVLEATYGQDPRKIICLDVPDLYERGAPVLVYILEQALQPYLTS